MRENKASAPKECAEQSHDESFLSVEWLNQDEMLKKLGVSRNTLKKLRSTKALLYSKIGGKIYYNVTDVQNMLLHFRRHSF